MSNPGDTNATAITSVRQLTEYIAAGCKPPGQYRIGTEHEKFGFRLTDLAPPPYGSETGDGRDIRTMLEVLSAEGGQPIYDSGQVIGLGLKGGGSISLEPAGQLELSGAMLASLHETRAEIQSHLKQVHSAGERLGLGFAPLGFHPVAARDQMPWMPKGRYAIMRRYMPLVGTLGLDMMTRTCTVQVNLDYASEADMRRKLRLSLLIQPLATALFANSPFAEGKPSGYLSTRAHIWEDTDNARSGAPPLMFDPDFGFESYVNWLLDKVPMYFVYRNGRFIDVAGRRFRDFMARRIPELASVEPTIGDFADHMTTVFTDVRLKRFLEMRGADAGSPDMLVALPAFWVGLLYDEGALAAAEEAVAGHGYATFLKARAEAPGMGLDAAWGDGTLRDLARRVVPIAKDGLRARARKDVSEDDETVYLAPIEAIAGGAPSQAERWLERFSAAWKGNAANALLEAAI